MSRTEIKKVLREYEKNPCILILPGHIPINTDACMFDYLINVVMLKVHEGRSSKVRIRKRKGQTLLDILY